MVFNLQSKAGATVRVAVDAVDVTGCVKPILSEAGSLVAAYGRHLDLNQPVHAIAVSGFPYLPGPIQAPIVDTVWHSVYLHLPVAFRHLVQYLNCAGYTLSHVLHDASVLSLPVSLALLVGRFVNWLLLSSDVASSVKTVIRSVEFIGVLTDECRLEATYVERAAILGYDVPSGARPLSIKAHSHDISRAVTNLAVLKGNADPLHTYHSNTLIQAQRDLDARHCVHVPRNVGVGYLDALHAFAPEFAYQIYSYSQPHAAAAVARRVCMALAYQRMGQRDLPVVAVAASDVQVASCPRLVHNHAPELSGRDWYRYQQAYSVRHRQFARAVNCKCTLQTCPVAFPGTQLFLPLSAHDIPIGDVLRTMVSNGQRTATAVLHLPIPFLDPRVNTWKDADLDVRFERRKGEIIMYHEAEASAGYHNNAEALMSWVKPPPRLNGYCVTVEEVRSIGSLYVLEIRVSPGAQETYSQMHHVAGGRFYVLPLLKPEWLFNADEDRSFVVPASRFENVVKFAQISGTHKNAFELIANKVRGQESEIKVANQVIMPRWELSIDEFNSIVVHVIVCSNLSNQSSDVMARRGLAYVSDWFRRYEGSFFTRYVAYVKDTFTFAGIRGHSGMFEDQRSSFSKGFFGEFYRDGKFENPYELHGRFRLCMEKYVPRVTNTALTTLLDVDFVRTVPNSARPQFVKEGLDDIKVFLDYFSGFDDELFAVYEHLLPVHSCELPPVMVTLEEAIVVKLPSSAVYTTSSVSEVARGEEVSDDGASTTSRRKKVRRGKRVAVGPVSIKFSEVGDDRTASTLSSLEEDDGLRRVLQRLNGNFQVYHVQVPMFVQDLVFTADIDFKAPLSFLVQVDSSPSHQSFCQKYSGLQDLILDLNEETIVPAPDAGLLALVKLILKTYRARGKRIDFDALEYLKGEAERAARADAEVDLCEEGTSGLVDVIMAFRERIEGLLGAKSQLPALLINGIPGSAKSTVVRQAIAGRRALVVVPTGELRREWMRKVDQATVEVVTMHKVPEIVDHEFLIFDEANRIDDRLLQLWGLLAAHHGVGNVVAIGDEYQGKRVQLTNAVFGESYLRGPIVKLYNSFTMPIDSLIAFKQCNGISDDIYRTKSKLRSSIAFIDRTPDLMDFSNFDMHTRARVSADEIKDSAGRVIPSVTQVQGRRAVNHYFTAGLKAKQSLWFAGMQQIQSVLFTRHSRVLVVDMPITQARACFPNVQMEARIIDGNSGSKQRVQRMHVPGYLDYLPVIVNNSDHLYSAALPLHASYSTEEKLVPSNPIPEFKLTHEPVVVKVKSVAWGIAELIQEKSRFGSRRDYKEELNFYVAAAHGLLTCGELGWGDEPKMRSHLEGASALGDIQMARDRYNDLKNMCQRQLGEVKGINITAQDVSDGVILQQRYVQAFVAKEYTTTMFQPTTYDYMVNRTQAFLDAWNDPFGFAASSVGRQGFLKSQVKVKPGLNGQETHGQSIITNRPEMTNEFFDLCRLAIKGFHETDRSDFITDCGLSDSDLESLMASRGVSARIEGGKNLQVDLTKQDSTHRPAHVIAFALHLIGLGGDEERIMCYVALRAMAFVKSQAANLYTAILKWNLGSGDGFTLPANCHMMKSTLAVKYDNLANVAGVQKGDDFLSSNEGYVLGGVPAVYLRLRVVTKVDEGLPAYHAGRYLYGGRWLADPVRVFFRHYSKVYDSAVSVEDLFRSFNDRSVDYSEEERRYLITVVPLHYTDITAEQARVIVDTVLSLRSFKFFRSTYKYQERPALGIYSPSTDCAYLVARFLAPQLSNATLRKFRYHDEPEVLAKEYRKYGIPAIVVGHPSAVPRDYSGAVLLPGHAYAKVSPSPAR